MANDTAHPWECKGKVPVLDARYGPAQLDKYGYYVGAWKKVSPSVTSPTATPPQGPRVAPERIPTLPLVPIKYCGEYVRDGDPKGCYDTQRGAIYTRKWYVKPGTTAAVLPWFPERKARIVYMRSFGKDHIYLEGCGYRVDINIAVPNNGFPISCPNVTVSSSTGEYLYISSSAQ